ncbi:hypothetical protein AF332_04680 [Sporosarcina globispora]|uniref:Uncharacterized protein n=1 Tax=Sporosarcina globispora TaxID=1459 RepID=A0A0M0G8U6_SPOGL|nr:hypothetical protein [Sporosarcina globispora]KON86188.1 hypothetical protein AF332_04680 [Sporosarcina globispora]
MERRSPNQALIRTEEAENREKESELGAHSDRRSRKPGEGVRTWPSFGQRKQKTGRRSPNQGLIRTEKAEIREKESESRAHSDRESRNPREGVRIRRSFGQKKQKIGRRSPNQGLIRTEKAEIREKESESRAHSDRESRNPREGVRIKGSFGQKKQKSVRRSPN